MTRLPLLLLAPALFFYIIVSFFGSEKPNCNVRTDIKGIFERPLSVADVRTLDDVLHMQRFREILSKINIIRPIGTANHTLVQKFIENELNASGWIVSSDKYEQPTVIGLKNFTNIIAINKPQASRRIILSCHYESKLMHNFFGTIDSAVPCSIIINIAQRLASILKLSKADIAVQLIFFDGEESFREWTDTDSLYGSRHLATRMAQKDPYGCSDIGRIDLFVLLDLIGAPGYPFPRYPHCDSRFYDMLYEIERLLNPLFTKSHNRGRRRKSSYFSPTTYLGVEDDHKPFLDKGVPVLHLIPAPFPPQWHDITDTIENIDFGVIHDIQLIVATFLCQFLQVSPTLYSEPLQL